MGDPHAAAPAVQYRNDAKECKSDTAQCSFETIVYNKTYLYFITDLRGCQAKFAENLRFLAKITAKSSGFASRPPKFRSTFL